MSDVSPTEDLMREHGLLDRVLLIYDELAERLAPTFGSFLLKSEIALTWEAAEIIRAYIEGFHEELEEQYVFPVMKAKGLAGLVKTLDTQHNAGREITKAIQALTRADMRGALRDQREQLADMLRSFTRMYRPHAAREDTVLFREFRDSTADVTLRELAHEFARLEHDKFGPLGFEDFLARVGVLENQLGIGDLNAFTPPQPDRNF